MVDPAGFITVLAEGKRPVVPQVRRLVEFMNNGGICRKLSGRMRLLLDLQQQYRLKFNDGVGGVVGGRRWSGL